MAQSITVRPSILMQSDAFRNGFDVAQRNEDYTGWPIKYAPREDTVVQFVRDMCNILVADGFGDFETRWIAGLFCGWLVREEAYTKGH